MARRGDDTAVAYDIPLLLPLKTVPTDHTYSSHREHSYSAMAGSIPDEDESVLSLSAQTRRPLDTALRQQRIAAWYPYLDPWWVVGTLFILAAIFTPVGFKIQSMSNEIVEVRVEYDRYDDANPLCGIGTTPNANINCTLQFDIPADMEPPILVHYELSNFYQNHRNYVKSRDSYQVSESR